MRLTTVILIASILQVGASGFAQKLTFKTKDGGLKQLFTEIKKQTGYNVVWNADKIKSARPITVNFVDVDLENALNLSLAGQKLTYTIEKKTIVIKEKEHSFSENGAPVYFVTDVSGLIVDENGQPLPGATVRHKKSGRTTQTDTSGEFLLKGVEENDIIEVTFLGFKAIETTAKARMGTIKMTPTPNELNSINVVSTGYQTISKERSAGSYAKPDMQVVSDRSNSMNILQRLDGQLAGLTTNNAPVTRTVAGIQGNAPGSASYVPEFVVRGISSISLSANPLYVVDGVPINDLSSINPQDVADITLLKDATAASIWGARAANGVIVVTTKKGQAGDKLSIQYNGFVNFQGKPDLDYFPVVSSRDYIQAIRETFDPVANPYTLLQSNGQSSSSSLQSGIQPVYQFLYDHNRGLMSTAQLNSKLDSLSQLDNRQQIKDLFYRDAMLSNHTLSLRGGGNAYAFYGSLAFTDTKSSRPTEKNDTYKINLRQDLNLGKRIQAYLITDLTNIRSSSDRPLSVDYKFIPYQMFKDQAGNNLNINYMGTLTEENRIAAQNASLIDLSYNPLNQIGAGFTKGDNLFARITGGAKVKLFDGLRYEGVYSYMYGVNKTRDFDDQTTYAVRLEAASFAQLVAGSAVPKYNLPIVGGRYGESSTDQRNWTIRNSLVYDKNFNRHQITALAGLEAQDQLNFNTSSLVRGYDLNLQTYAAIDFLTLRSGISNYALPTTTPGLPNALGSQPFTRTENEFRFSSYFANLGYTFDGKYTLNASLRGDKSNLFGLDKSAQGRPVWSVGAKWLLTKEAFLSDAKWLNVFAVRATYGLAGNSPAPGSAASYNIFSASSSAFFPNQTGLSLSSPANTRLTWETTKISNFGFDFTVLDNRISASVDYYHKKTFDLLGTMPVNPISGYAFVSGNYGDMINNGLDLNISSLNLRNAEFQWNSTLNLAYNKNQITRLNNPTALTTGAQLVSSNYATGYSAFSVFAYGYAGLNNLGDPTIRLANGDISATYLAHTPADIKYMGTYQPVWSGGLSNTFQYKGFRLSANAVFNLGHVIRRDVGPSAFQGTNSGYIRHDSAISLNGNGGFEGGGIYNIFLERWKKPGDEAFTNIPAFAANSAQSAARRGGLQYWTFADINVISASFVKMRDITLSYDLSKSAVKVLGVGGVTLRTQVSNVMLWRANEFGIDPEFHFPGGARVAPINQGTITFGLNVNL